MEQPPKPVNKTERALEPNALKAGTAVELKKLSVKSGKSTEIDTQVLYRGTLAADFSSGQIVKLLGPDGKDIMNTSSVVAVRPEAGRILIETETSIYEMRIAQTPKESSVERGGVRREYTIADIEAFQKACAGFEQLRKNEKASYVLGSNQFYEYLVSGSLSERAPRASDNEMAKERDASPQEWEGLILSTFNAWKQNILANWDAAEKRNPTLRGGREAIEQKLAPKSLENLRDLIRKNRWLGDVMGFKYQDGLSDAGTVENPFLHFFGHRMSGYKYERPETAVRFYANPRRDAMPAFAADFIKRANAKNVPFYFKLIDFSLQQPSLSDVSRLDRFVFYVGKEETDKTKEIFDEMRKEHPEWFENRPVPALVADMGGFGIAEDPSDYQNANFSPMGKPSTSFNLIRAEMLQDTWKATVQEFLTRNADARMKDGKTVRQLFEESFAPDEQEEKRKIIAAGLNPSALGQVEQRSYNRALERLIPNIATGFEAATLLPIVQRHIRVQAAKYHVDPDNLAFNKD